MGEEHHINGSAPADSKQPYPVPGYIRTKNRFPRLIASVLATAWIGVFAFGTSALAKIEHRRLSPLDRFFAQPQAYWGTRTLDTANGCTSFFVSTVTTSAGEAHSEASEKKDSTKDNVVLSFKGASRIRFDDIPILAEFHLESSFNVFLTLDRFTSELRAGELSIRARSESDSESVEVIVDAGDVHSSYSIPNTPPIFLHKRDDQTFALRIPTEYQSLINRYTEANLEQRGLVQLSAEEFASCKNHVLRSPIRDQQSVFNVAAYVNLFPQKIPDEFLELLRDTSLVAVTSPTQEESLP